MSDRRTVFDEFILGGSDPSYHNLSVFKSGCCSLLFLTLIIVLPPAAPQATSPRVSRTPSLVLPSSPSGPRPLPSPKGSPSRQFDNRSQILVKKDSPSPDAGYTELYPSPQSYVERLQDEEAEGPGGIGSLNLDDGNVYFSPVVETVSLFRPSGYQSALMPKENKPLEVGILRRVKELLAEVDPRTAAQHITKADCSVRIDQTHVVF